MADGYSVFNPTVDLNPYSSQIAEVQRRQRMAQLLQQQGAAPFESQTASGRVIPISPWQVLAKALQTGLGAYQGSQADKAAADLREQMAYDQRQKEAEIASAGQQIMGRIYGEKPPQYDKMGMPVMPRETEPAVTEPSQPSDQLGEITPTAQYQYQYDPAGALQMAMTPAGARAMQGNPMLASMLAQMAKPKTLEIGAIDPSKFTPESIRAAQSTGDYSRLQPIVATKEATPTNLSKLIAEREALPANSPLRAIYNEAIANEGKPSAGVTVNYGTPVAGVDEQGNPVFFQPSRGGGAPAIIPGVRPKPEEPKEFESKSAIFANQMILANPVFDAVPPPSVSAEALSKTPLVGNVLISPEARKFQQAEENFLTAVLRDQSGATIGSNEFYRDRKKYIPMAGDDAATLEAKRKARASVIEGMKKKAGPAYKPDSASVGAPVSGGSNADIFSQADAILGR